MPVADQAQTEFNGSMGARYIGDRSEGQSFIAGKDGFLEGIEVGFSGFIGGDFEVAIYEQSHTKPSTVNQWVLQVYPNKLGSLVLKNDNIDKNFNRYSSYFDVSSLGIPQAKGSEYFFSITPKGSDIPDPYGVDVFVKTDSSIPDPYPAGSRMTSYDGSTYYLYPDYDLYFKTYVSEEQRNRAPTSVDLTAISFDENIPAGSVVSTLITIDADEDDFFSYSFVAGDGDSDNSLFAIEGDKLKFLDSPNYETKSSYSIRVQTTDSGGLSFEAPLTLSVTDLEEDNDIANYSPNREWTQLLGTPTSDYGFSVDTSEDGSVYMAGYTKGNLDGQSNSGNFDAFLSKYNHDGLKVWTRLIGNSNFQNAHSVSVDANGAAYVTGSTSGNLHGQSNSGSNDVFLSKYNSDGSREWTKLIGSTSLDWGHSVSTADDGSVYVAGSTAGNLDGQTNSGGIDAFLSKYNSDGSKEWTEILGSSSQVWVHSVSTSQDDAIYIAGDTRGNLDGKTIHGERDGAAEPEEHLSEGK